MLNAGSSATTGLVAAKNAVGREIFTGSLDVLPELVKRVRDGELTFASTGGDMAQLLFVVQLIHYIRYGLVQANYYLTSPIIVDLVERRPGRQPGGGWCPLGHRARTMAAPGLREAPRGGHRSYPGACLACRGPLHPVHVNVP